MVPTGTIGTVTGWGFTHNEEITGSWEGPPAMLRKVELPKVDQRSYQAMHQSYYPNVRITDRMTCYGYNQGGKDACEGDSGGPLVANGKQVGIISWGLECGTPNAPGIYYTRLENEEIYYHIKSCLARFAEQLF